MNNNRKFFKIFQKILSGIIITVLLLSGSLIYNPQPALAATYYWTQSSWAGGATTTTAVHPTNKTGWT